MVVGQFGATSHCTKLSLHLVAAPMTYALEPVSVGEYSRSLHRFAYNVWQEDEQANDKSPAVEILLNGSEYFPRLFELSEAARSASIDGDSACIRMHAYRMSPDIGPYGAQSGDRLIKILGSLCAAGVGLDVSLSPHLARRPNRIPMLELAAAGVPVRWGQGSMKYASHEKFALFADSLNATLLVGSLDPWKPRWDDSRHLPHNPHRFGERIEPTHDLALEIALGPVVPESILGLNSLDSLSDHMPEGLGIVHKKSREDRRLLTAMRDAIDSAEDYIYIEDQYFLPNIGPPEDSLLGALCRAIQRGVNLLVVMPAPCHPASPRGHIEIRSELMFAELVKASERTQGTAVALGRMAVDPANHNRSRRLYVHSKVVVVDDRVALVGSQNFTNRSLVFDDELTVIIQKRSFVQHLRETLWRSHFDGTCFRPKQEALGVTECGLESFNGRVVAMASGRTPRVWALGERVFRTLVDPES